MLGPMWTPAARADLDDIWAYTVATWGPDQAETYVRAIARTCADLTTGDQPSQSAAHVRPGYRRVRSGRHVVFFTGTGADIVVIRVLHMSMDVDAHLP